MITYLEDSRTQAGLTQHQLAAAAGINRMTVVAIEGGRRPHEATARAVVAALAQSGAPEVDPDLLHRGRMRSSSEIMASFHLVGRLLSWLPLQLPDDPFWSTLGEHLQMSPGYMRGKLRTLHAEIFGDEDRDPAPWIAEDLRHILLFLPPEPDTATALLGGHWFGNRAVAMLWLRSLTDAAWQLWLYTNPDHSPQ